MLKKLQDYAASGAYPFHMPGHKRQLEATDFPFSIDITEIDDFDNLHHPEGCIKEIEDTAARLYNAERAFLLVNGATGGILSAVKAMTYRSGKVIVARNCHTSVYHAIELLGLVPVYYLPDQPKGERIYRCFGNVDPDKLDQLLNQHSDAKLFVMTSPTYEGICSDVFAIANICHRHGVRLLVDEAHGAHFPFHYAFPENAVACGADCAVVSLHKTMPAMTQTALLLLNDIAFEQRMQSALAVFQTSSPSYVLMSSIACALGYAQSHPDAFDAYIKRLQRIEERLTKLKKLFLLFHDRGEELKNVFAYDRGKLVISTHKANLSGIALANILRKKYNLEIEMAASDYIIAMTSVCDTDDGFERLANALVEIDSKCDTAQKEKKSSLFGALPERRFLPCECDTISAKAVPLSEAAGRTTMEDFFAYPPGSPIVVRGEVLTEEILCLLREMTAKGVNLISSGNTYPYGVSVADL